MYQAQDIRDTHHLMSHLKHGKAFDNTDDDDGNMNDTNWMMNSDK